FESTGFANFTESKEYKDAGFETKAQFAKTGFINLRQQKALKKYGKSHDEAIASESEISLSRFVECDKAGGSMYKYECQGKQVLWYAKIDRHADDGVYLDVVNKCGIDERYSKAVWSKELSYDFWKENDDSCILVLAEIKSENFRTPTIKVKSVVWSETPDEKRQRVLEAKRLEAERIDQKKKQEKLQRELEERKRKSQLEANKFNPEWLVDEYGIMAGIRCEDYVENLAKNTFRWTDGWLEAKFPRYLVSNDEEPYVITIIGDKIEFQNGFGAWGKVTYFCKYDTKAEEVLYAYAE
ncbi:hypothetical protein PQY68_06125, partial [Planktomarina temperata]|nr:hypothetical protein [Planktomarina temperata]